MLRRSAAKAVQELNLLRSCTQDTLQGAGQQCCQVNVSARRMESCQESSLVVGMT